jgi:tetratricopeptide (TPR) repeat protein
MNISFQRKVFPISLMILSLTIIWCSIAHSAAGPRKVKVAVFPFNDLSISVTDMRVSSVLAAELATKDFIEIIPLEIIKSKILEVEPAFLWIGKRRAAILWKIEAAVVEEVARKLDAEYSIYGDISWFGTKWVINAYVCENSKTIKVFSSSGEREGEIPSKLSKMADEIAVLIRKETIAEDAEEEVRRFLGGMYSLPVVISKIERLSQLYPDSLPLHAILLDIYLRDKAHYKKGVLEVAQKIITLYDPSNDADTRYLLSLSLDPFDVLARIHEEEKEWIKAMEIREKALQLFPFYADKHRAGIGFSAYALAAIYEQKGEKDKSIAYYRKALSHLPPTSKELAVAKERLKILETK